jgi:hypothetical protein
MATTEEIIESCPFCGQRLRFPTHLFVPLIVTCPPCRHRWDWQRSKPSAQSGSQYAPELESIRFAPVLAFQDTKEFYKELSKEVRSGEPVTIETTYVSESEFPEDLKRFIKAETARRSRAPGRGLQRRPILVMALMTTAGASMGLGVVVLFGGTIPIVGSAVGAMLGLITGAVSTSIGSGTHRVEIVLDIHGKIIIRFNPVTSKSSAEAEEGNGDTRREMGS